MSEDIRNYKEKDMILENEMGYSKLCNKETAKKKLEGYGFRSSDDVAFTRLKITEGKK